MTAAMASLATGTDQVRGASGAFQSLFFVGLLLFAITLILNIISERFVARVRQRYWSCRCPSSPILSMSPR